MMSKHRDVSVVVVMRRCTVVVARVPLLTPSSYMSCPMSTIRCRSLTQMLCTKSAG